VKLSSQKKLSVALMVVCGLLMLFATLQKLLGIGTGYSLLSGEELPISADLMKPLVQSQESLGPEAEFLEINTSFLFTKDRVPPQPPKPPGEGEAEKVVPPVPLNLQLTGVVITPDKRIAMLRATDGQATFRVHEGRPLPGERAGWTLKQVSNRSVMFDGGTNGEQELMLQPALPPHRTSRSQCLPDLRQCRCKAFPHRHRRFRA
jgi:general secretion pathway protein N